MNSRLMTATLVVSTAFILAGCSHAASPNSQTSGGGAVPAADQKQGDTTKTGTISQSGELFFINVAGSQPELLESYSVELGQYLGQTVTVTGQYSGDTLFVGDIR